MTGAVQGAQYYPAIFVGDFQGAEAALSRLGIVGQDAEFVLAEQPVTQDRPVVFEIVIRDSELAGQSSEFSRTAVVLLERQDGKVGLWFGLFAHLRSDPEEALASFIEETLENPPEHPPTVDVFEWAGPERTVQ